MNVLKFGGTSVANAQNIKLVLNIINESAKKDQLVVVVSAFSGVTDLLVLASSNASAKDKNYKEIVSQIEKKHKEAIPVLQQLGLIEKDQFDIDQIIH